MLTATLWVVISLVGFVFAAVDVVGAYSHYNLVRMGWPDHERLAGFTRYQFLSQFARMILLLVFLILGINSLADGPRGLSVYAMLIGNLVVVWTAIQSHRYRRKVFREERAEYRKKEDSERVESRSREDADRRDLRAKQDREAEEKEQDSE